MISFGGAAIPIPPPGDSTPGRENWRENHERPADRASQRLHEGLSRRGPRGGRPLDVPRSRDLRPVHSRRATRHAGPLSRLGERRCCGLAAGALPSTGDGAALPGALAGAGETRPHASASLAVVAGVRRGGGGEGRGEPAELRSRGGARGALPLLSGADTPQPRTAGGSRRTDGAEARRASPGSPGARGKVAVSSWGRPAFQTLLSLEGWHCPRKGASRPPLGNSGPLNPRSCPREGAIALGSGHFALWRAETPLGKGRRALWKGRCALSFGVFALARGTRALAWERTKFQRARPENERARPSMGRGDGRNGRASSRKRRAGAGYPSTRPEVRGLSQERHRRALAA